MFIGGSLAGFRKRSYFAILRWCGILKMFIAFYKADKQDS